MICGPERRRPIDLKRTLPTILMAGLISGCSLVQGIFGSPQEATYRPEIPYLQAKSLEVECSLGGRPGQECTCLASRDYREIVRKLKASCLALGGTDIECQTEGAPPQVGP